MESLREIVFKQIHMIDRLTKIYLRHGLKRYGLKEVGHPYILKMLMEPENNGQIDTQKEFSDVLMVSPPAIAQSLKRMTQEGLVEKINDESDLRVNQITITPRGVEFVKKMDENLSNMAQELFADFTDEELEQINQYNLRIIENLKKHKAKYE